MTKLHRVINVVIGILTIFCAVLMLAMPDYGYYIAAAILCITFLVSGVRQLIYYFSMARYMVGGKKVLFDAMISLDFGLFATMILFVPNTFMTLYLTICFMATGGVTAVKAFEERRFGASSWKLTLIMGLVNIAIAIVCMFFGESAKVAVYAFAFGLLCTAVMKIVTAFRKAAIVYIA